MSTLSSSMTQHLCLIEGHATAARNAVEAGLTGAAIFNMDVVIASLREAQASLAHDADIEETRAVKQGTVKEPSEGK